MQKRRERVMGQLIDKHKVLPVSIDTRRLLHRAEVEDAGNETPKLTDAMVLVRLILKLEGEGKLKQTQVVVKPSEDEKAFVTTKLMLAIGIDVDGPEVQAE